METEIQKEKPLNLDNDYLLIMLLHDFMLFKHLGKAKEAKETGIILISKITDRIARN